MQGVSTVNSNGLQCNKAILRADVGYEVESDRGLVANSRW